LNGQKRVDVNSFKNIIDNLPVGELDRLNRLQHEEAIDEHNRFKEHYQRGECYLCGKSYKTISKNNPCIHWLLRRCKFKSKDFSKIYQQFDYHQIASFLRWVANQERFQGNINDLLEEKDESKLFETTIKWKNIEWTFNCSRNDYSGHDRGNSNYPHYHFQMRIDKKQFINFGQHHIPFSEKDLFNLDLLQQKPELIRHSFGSGGAGMQDALEVCPHDIVKHTTLAEDEKDATYHMQTMVMAKDKPLKGEDLKAMIEESRDTGKPLAGLVGKYLGDSAEVQTIISPVDTIPDIAKRTRRRKK
jgi:hypothetical protein